MGQSKSRGQKSPRIGIIGAGPGGLCMGIRLLQAGYDDFVIFDKAAGVGGTWYHNRYPGCACDVGSHLYSFSFEPNSDWPRPYAAQPQIREYMESCADKYGLRPHLRLGCGVEQAIWNEERSEWTLRTSDGASAEFDVVVSAVGMFNDLAYPEIAGLDRFEGTLFHSARWNWDHDLDGERVGVIGSAASAVQFVPEIAKRVEKLDLYQRTANWVTPKEDDPFSDEQIQDFRDDPESMLSLRSQIYDGVNSLITYQDQAILDDQARRCLEAMEVVTDASLRKKLVPDHPFGCKRPLISNDYYPTFNRPNVELVTDPIREITKEGVVLESGQPRAYDTLILATGFAASKYLSAVDVRGRAGLAIEDAWKDGAHAYLGVTTAGFPNLFMLYGPNTNNGSILFMIECQVDYALRQIRRIDEQGLAWLDVRADVMASYNQALQEEIAAVEVWQANCNGYYRSPSGRIVTQWPHDMNAFRDRLASDDPDAFDVGAG